ncbi:MAG: flagellar filament capping protein FliD [Ignavibacteriaceae bacterium]
MSGILSSSTISSLVQSYISNETNISITPLQNQVQNYQNVVSSYGTLSTNLSALNTELATLQVSDNSSVFASKTATSSNSTFVTATASGAASIGVASIRVNQLAQNDTAISENLTSATANAITGTHHFVINAGDGNGGQTNSDVYVTFGTSETNQTVMQKIANAINSSQAVVTSASKLATAAYSGGAAAIAVNLNGTTTTLNLNSGDSTYDQVLNDIASQINSSVSGVSAKVIADPNISGNEMLKMTVTNNSNYISISNASGYNIVGDLGIAATEEKSAAGTLTGSVFTPSSGQSQLSLTAAQTGLDYRIMNMSDVSGSTALSSVGLNLGTSRPVFSQSTSPNTAGFIYADTTLANNLLNSKFIYNGINLQNDSNKVSNLVSGVTYNLNSVMQSTDTTVNVSIGTDVNTIQTEIQNFITKFNTAYTYVKSNSTPGTTNRGVFMGDPNGYSILNGLGSVGYSAVSGLPAGSLNYLTQIGISFDPTNGLSVSNSTELQQAIANNSSQVEAMFNSTNGIANSLSKFISPYLGAGGYLALTQNSYNNNISYLNDRITSAQTTINTAANNLTTQYEQMQAQLTTLTNMQSYYTSTGQFF